MLGTLDVLSDAAQAVRAAFVAHRVTLTRIAQDVSAAWGQLRLANGIDGNVAIVRGYITRFVDDLKAAVREIVDGLLAAVRSAVVPLVEPLLVRPEVAPVWNLACMVLGANPLTGQAVQATGVQILEGFLTVLGRAEVAEQMRERGTLQTTADWLGTQLNRFDQLLGTATALFSDAWNAISPSNLPQLLDTLPGLASRAVTLLADVKDFAQTVITQVLAFVKDSLLQMLSDHAGSVRGFRLLTVILGRNPFTGNAVERTAAGLIGGFIELVAGQDTYRQLEETGVIAEAAGRIESEMQRLNISWDLIAGTFRAIWDSFSLNDLLDPIGAIERTLEEFGEPLGRIVSFAATVVEVVIELVLKLMNFPTELLAGIIAGVQAAVADIKADPVGFLRNLLNALLAGFQGFFDRVLTHLVGGLAAWLFRGLRSLGIEPPTELSGQAVLNLVLQVLGLTEEFLWERLTAAVGPERVAQIRGALETLGQAWSFLSDVRERGLVAVWEMISSQLSSLWETILSTAQDWLMTNLIQAAITKVLSMLDPTGIMAIVNSAIAFFRAVQSVLDYLTELLEIIKGYVDTLVAIARGEIAPGAAMVERGLANAIPVAIGFLANQVGLGNVPEKIIEIIGRLRAVVTRAIDWLIVQALRLGAATLRALSGRTDEPEGPSSPGVEETSPGTDSIEVPVVIGGVTHHLRNDAEGHSLAVHSATVLVNSIKDPDLEDLVEKFNVATTKTAKKAAVEKIAEWISTHAAGQGPGGSAPNIGAIERHGSQPPRLVNVGVPLWSLRSEHVVPFAIVRKLWEALGVEGVAPRADLSSEDRDLTTIMIYLGAALEKDIKEASRRRQAQARLQSMTEHYAVNGNSAGEADTPAADAVFRAEVMTVLRQEQIWFTEFTWGFVQQEHATFLGLSTHGGLRNETAPLPSKDAIGQAAREEIDVADRILERSLAEAMHPQN